MESNHQAENSIKLEEGDKLLRTPTQKKVDDKIVKNNFENDKNLLQIACQNDINSLKLLLKHSKCTKFETWCEALKIVQDNNFHEFSFILQTIEEEFYGILNDEEEENLEESFEIINGKKFVPKALISFHESIKSGNFQHVQNFVQKFPNFKFCFDQNKISALEQSFDHKQFKIFAFLMSESFLAMDQKKLDDKISKLEKIEKRKIRDENLKFFKINPCNFIHVLITQCDIFSSSGIVSFVEIQRMLEVLSQNELLRVLLKFVSQSNVTIHFDFKTPSIKSMDPTCDEHVMGLADYKNDTIYVGKDQNKSSRYGNFVHEVCHYALHLLYDNDCLPYFKHDRSTKESYDKVFDATKALKDNEKIVNWAFSCYPNNQKEAELIVRVPHLLGFYLESPKKLEEVREVFKDLFNFFEENILKDLKVKNNLRIIKLNNKFEVIKKIQELNLKLNKTWNILSKESNLIIVSNVPQWTLQCTLTEVKNLPGNFKIKNIFVDVEKLSQNVIKEELEYLLQNSEIDRIIFKCDDLKILEYFEKKANKVQIIAIVRRKIYQKYIEDKSVANPDVPTSSDASNGTISKKVADRKKSFQVHVISHEISELPPIGISLGIHKKVIKFQQTFQNFVNFCPSFDLARKVCTSDVLEVLCDESLPNVNVKKIQNLENFIPRIIQSNSEEFSIEDFIEKVKEDCIVLIADCAGSGKTSVLREVERILLESYKNFWISFVSLRDYINEIKNSKNDETFMNFMIRILKLDPLEQLIFIQKFQNGEVKILFDAFDEISPSCKNQMKKIFEKFEIENSMQKFFEKADNKKTNQLWITTRTHLEEDLKKLFNVQTHKIKILSKKEQIEYLKNFWKNSNKDLASKCAQKLVERISDLMRFNSAVIGIILILQGLAKYFKDKISKNFLKEKLKMHKIYKKIVIREALAILNQRFPKKVEKLLESDGLLNVHKFFAIVHLFDAKLASKLGLRCDEKSIKLEEVARAGIISYGDDKKVRFNHQTYAEYLIALIIFERIRSGKIYDSLLELFFKVLERREFAITRMFLEDMIGDWEEGTFLSDDDESDEETEVEMSSAVSNSLLNNFYKLKFKFRKFSSISNYNNFNGLGIFKCSKKVYDRVTKKNPEDRFYLLIEEGLLDFFRLILNIIKKQSLKYYLNVLEFKFYVDRERLLMRILPNFKDERKFLRFLSEIYEFYGQNLHEFLMLRDAHKNTIFHFILMSYDDPEIFKIIWENSNLKPSQLDQICACKNYKDRTFFTICIRNNNKPEMVYEILNILNQCSDKARKKIILNRCNWQSREFVLRFITTWMDFESFKIIFEFVDQNLSDQEMQKAYMSYDYRGSICLHRAAFSESLKFFKVLWKRAEEILNVQKLFEYKNFDGQTFLHHAIENEDYPEVFEYILELGEKNFGLEDFLKFLEENFLIHFLENGEKEFLEIFFEKYQKVLSFEDQKLLSAAKRNKNSESIQYMRNKIFRDLTDEEFNKQTALNVLKVRKEYDVVRIFKSVIYYCKHDCAGPLNLEKKDKVFFFAFFGILIFVFAAYFLIEFIVERNIEK